MWQRERRREHVECIPYLARNVAQPVQVPLQMVLAADLPGVGEVVHTLERQQLLPRDFGAGPGPEEVEPQEGVVGGGLYLRVGGGGGSV